jgi:hypothetical protein
LDWEFALASELGLAVVAVVGPRDRLR